VVFYHRPQEERDVRKEVVDKFWFVHSRLIRFVAFVNVRSVR
jgi:hypothetical protein